MFSLFACAQQVALKKDPAQVQDSSTKVDISHPDNQPDDEAIEAWFNDQSDGKVGLKIGDIEIRVEYADTQNERRLGLMYRKQLCAECGMLFKFDREQIGSIWMKNTFIPLDLAYITTQGKIVDIAQLQAHDLTPIKSSELVLYALEMNQGWFASKDIRVGETVTNLP